MSFPYWGVISSRLRDIFLTVRQLVSTGVEYVRCWLRRRRRAAAVTEALDEPGLIQQAYREWQSAQALFEQVHDPDLVDQAIHRLTAAEKRYMYLLRRVQAAQAAE